MNQATHTVDGGSGGAVFNLWQSRQSSHATIFFKQDLKSIKSIPILHSNFYNVRKYSMSIEQECVTNNETPIMKNCEFLFLGVVENNYSELLCSCG